MDVKWDSLPDLPHPLLKHPPAVLIDTTLYVGGPPHHKDHAHTIFTYDLKESSGSRGPAPSWDKLPVRCPRRDFGMIAIKGTLVIVGGVDSASSSNKRSNKVTVWDETAKQWREGFYPSLANARASPALILYRHWLIAIGGTADKQPLNTIEKFNLDSTKSNWTPCPPLPEKCVDLSAIVVKETLYVAGTSSTPVTAGSSSGGGGGGGMTGSGGSGGSGGGGGEGVMAGSQVAYSILLPLLVRMKPKDVSAWEQLPNIPNHSASLCCVSRKTLLAFGGVLDITSSLASLSPLVCLEKTEVGFKWERVGSLPCERGFCTCLRVGGDRVVLVGGVSGPAGGQGQQQQGLKRVDVCTFQGRR